MVALILLLVLCACSAPGSHDSRALAALVDAEWEARLAARPVLATGTGRREYDHLLADPSAAAEARRTARDRAWIAELEALDPAALAVEERITHAMLLRELRDRVADFEHGAWRQPLTSDSGFHTALAQLPRRVPLGTVAEVEAYLARLRAIPAYVDAQLANLRQGLADGVSLPAQILAGYEHTIAAHVVAVPEKSVFYAPLADLDAALPEAERRRLQAQGRAAVMEGAVEGFRRLLRFWLEEYLPGARTSLGISQVEGGRAWYEHLVRHFTTLDLTPEQVHRLGLREVARIRADMQATLAAAGFEGSFEEFLAFLRGDERFYARTPEELLARASRLAKRADAALPRFFGHLPRLPYGVAPVPDAIAPRYTGGRYVPSSAGSGEPGWYWVNTYDLPSRPLYVLPALTLHEAVPGHHLQIALAAELEGLPEFRRFVYVDAFGEGWALYCEWLGQEMGLYDDPYEEFGRLTYEMWRACRLVVDTGIHAFGWSREQALEYLAGNTALSLHECRTEVDRYVSWPGQALSYKIGELEIRRLRAEAERRLGPAFDLRAFHDEVIGHGALPLDVLGEVIEAWITSLRGS